MYNVGMLFLCFPLEKNVEHIQNLIGLNNIPEYFIHVGIYIFGPQSETTCFVVKYGQKFIAIFALIGQFILVLRHPPNISSRNNFANDKGASQSIQSYYIEPCRGWIMCSKIGWLVVQ